MTDWKSIDTRDLAGLISRHLQEKGIDATLVGGACVTIYSKNSYISGDLDFVTYAPLSEIEKVLNALGFHKVSRRHFEHPECPFFIEFLAPPVAIGGIPVDATANLETSQGILNLLTVEDCIRDRLAAYYYWDDPQALSQAVAVARKCRKNLDFSRMADWSTRQNFSKKFQTFLRQARIRLRTDTG